MGDTRINPTSCKSSSREEEYDLVDDKKTKTEDEVIEESLIEKEKSMTSKAKTTTQNKTTTPKLIATTPLSQIAKQ